MSETKDGSTFQMEIPIGLLSVGEGEMCKLFARDFEFGVGFLLSPPPLQTPTLRDNCICNTARDAVIIGFYDTLREIYLLTVACCTSVLTT